MKSSLQFTEDQIAKLSKEKSELVAQIESAKAFNTQQLETVNEKSNSISKELKELDIMKAEREQILSQKEKKNSELESLKNDIAALTKQLEDLELEKGRIM